MDPQLRSERRNRWESDSVFERDSWKYRLARRVRKYFTARTLIALLLLELMLLSIHSNFWLVQVPVILVSLFVVIRLVLVRLSGKHKRQTRFVQLVDHQNVVVGRPAESAAEV